MACVAFKDKQNCVSRCRPKGRAQRSERSKQAQRRCNLMRSSSTDQHVRDRASDNAASSALSTVY